MHISQIQNLDEFINNNFGQTYYSVGPLDGPIEEWTFTNDRFDMARLRLGNFFLNKSSSEMFMKYMLEYYKDKK